MPRGGRRAGSGRRPKSERFRTKISTADKIFADKLNECVLRLHELADGGIETVERKYQPAGLVTVKTIVVLDNGTITDPVERLAFPDLDPDQLVCVEEKRGRTLPDRTALIYWINRILGRPFAEPQPSDETDSEGYAEIPVPADTPDVEARE